MNEILPALRCFRDYYFIIISKSKCQGTGDLAAGGAVEGGNHFASWREEEGEGA